MIAALLSPFALHFSPMNAQTVVSDGFDRLEVTYKAEAPERHLMTLDGITFLLTMPGYTSGGVVGSPALPVRNDVIEIPFCDDIRVTVANAVYDTLQYSYTLFYPLQASRSKSDTSASSKLYYDEERYSTDAFYGLPVADVEVMGVARDRRLALLTFSPVQVNPVTGQVVVCRSADVTVEYLGVDVDATLDHYRRYHTPAFSVGTTLNNLYSSNHAVKQFNNLPIRMVIAVPNALRCRAIEHFADWKRRQGMMVDVLYYQNQGIADNTALASYLQTLYDSASPEAPAPTYLLLVGDHGQLPAFDSQLPYAGFWSSNPSNDHVTDLYFTTWTAGDVLPDCYQGRFSAADTATLANIINKTLLYEQYAFTDDSYLGRAALVAGEDNGNHSASGWSMDYAWIYSDPSMDYVAYNYVNAANGFNEVTYFKNDTSYAPTGVTVNGYCSASTASADLLDLYDTGIGWINYSAHGDWDRWYKPSFTVNQVKQMNNGGKPSVMIGNCCLTNKFDESVCFGEALLRKDKNAGAVAYVGGTNSTYWEEDFFWSVGIRTNINHTIAPNYNAANLGTYDRLFHTHGEDFAAQVATMGAMVYYGNFAVQSSSSSASMKKYYWEIYELMGDPSLLPWLGTARELTPYVYLSEGAATLEVHTLPNAYVALVDADGTLHAASYTSDGSLSIPLSSPSVAQTSTVAITLQGYRPCFISGATLSIGTPGTSSLKAYPNPVADRLSIEGLAAGSTVEFFDIQGRQVLKSNLDSESSLDVSTLASGLYLLRVQTPETVTVQKIIKK